MILNDLSANKKASKKREFNNFSIVTSLVKKYKETNNQDDLLEILKSLEGIINTYTLICTPSDSQQSIYITPYMCKFLGMFLSSDERCNVNYNTYLHACQRIRWTLRHYTYEDMYARLLEILIKIIRKMKIIGDCDCIYYIQKMTQYQMYDLIMKASKDATTHVMEFDDNDDGDDDDYKYSRLRTGNYHAINSEFDFTESLYNDISVYALVESFDFYKLLSQYEKYLLYLTYGLYFTNKQISLLVRHKKEKEILIDLGILQSKILDASQEHFDV
jgi:hypothetical protein